MLPLPSIDCVLAPPRVRRGARLVETEDRLVVGLEEIRIRDRGLEPLGGDPLQHLHRVVRGRPPQRVIELAEHHAGAIVPAPPEIERELVQAMQARREGCGVGESFFRHVVQCAA